MMAPMMRTFAHRLVPAVLVALALAAPADAAEVARTEGARLDARDDSGGDFCLRLTTGEAFESGGSSTCGGAPLRPLRAVLVTTVDEDRLVAAGAVPAAIARAEAELAGGRRVGFETVPGPGYHGRHAGMLRFFLASLPLTDPADDEAGGLVAVRFFDASGALAGIAEADRSGVPVGPSKRLLRERRRGGSITLSAQVQRVLASTPLELDRFEELTCILVRSRSG